MSRTSNRKNQHDARGAWETLSLSRYLQHYDAEATLLGKGMKTALFIQQFRAGLLHTINPRAEELR